jgi:tetratricopeptide (TPR) repeat protein
MLQQQEKVRSGNSGGNEFGMLIFGWRGPIKRPKVLAHLPGWSKDTLHRLEKGEFAPAFEDLRPLFRALWLAGASIPPDGAQLFVKYARTKIESKRTHRDLHENEEWSVLSYDLAVMDRDFRTQGGHASSMNIPLSPLLLDTTHLIGREKWREDMKRWLVGPERRKVIVVEGPSGIGKTSELNRLAVQLLSQNSHRPILCDFHSSERIQGPEEALSVFMGTILSALGYAQPQVTPVSLEERVMILLEQVEKSSLPVVMLMDHAESILQEQGKLAMCWERFLVKFLRTQHRATLVCATKQWPIWFSGELRFLAEAPLPPLEEGQGVLLLQQLGLASVPLPLLHAISEKVGGIPLCLEWVAALAQQPLFENDLEEEQVSSRREASTPVVDATQAVRRLLREPHVFSGTLAEEVAPLLEHRILSDYRLSREAHRLLQIVSLATVPLAKPALDVLSSQWPHVVKELRRASLIVAYTDRVQALPSVASAVIRALPPEERFRQEEFLIATYQTWLAEGTFYENEKASMITELATLQLTHGQLLPAAQTLVRYGWLAFNAGHAIRLARLACAAIEEWEHGTQEQRQDQSAECGKWLLQYLLSPFLGEKINSAARSADYERLLGRVIAKSVTIQPHTDLFVTRHLMVSAMEQKRFADAQHLVETCEQRLAALIKADPDLQTSLLEKQVYLLTNWCEQAENQGDTKFAQTLRERAIAACQQSNQLLTQAEAQATPLKSSILKKRLAKSLTNLGFHLNRVGQFEKAIEVLWQSISLKKQGYTDVGSLPASYGELSQALAAVGRFDEALRYDELALDDIQRLGDTVSQETAWIYRINRGRLYVKVGRLAEARCLLEEAIPKLPDRWEMYRMFGRQALDEIKQREGDQVLPSQYDAQWVNQYRELVSFDSFAWLAPTHLTAAEQEEWDRLFAQRGDLEVKKTLETMLADSKQHELLLAIQAQREPRFFYPAIPVLEVRDRIRRLLNLAEEIRQREENAVVRRFYIGDPDGEAKGAIPYQVEFLQAIEATALENSEAFWQHICAISPPPTEQEMSYALSRVKWFIQQGEKDNSTKDISQQLTAFLEDRLSLATHTLSDTEEIRTNPVIDISRYGQPAPVARRRELPPEAVRKFFATVLRDQGCQGWEAVIDYAAQNTRIEPGLRHYIVAGVPYTLSKVNELIAHELGAHIAPRVAGERSALGILGLGNGWSLTTEEGLGLYYEWELAKHTGQRFDEAKVWLGTLATGLAAGVLVPPQTFLSLYTFLADFLLLYRLIFLGQENMTTAQTKARAVAQTRCLRTYRGVPDLSRPGICYPKDAVYERGFFQVYDAVAHDKTVLDWLTAGIVSLEQIHDLQALGISPVIHSSLALLAYPDLEAYILSFVEGESTAR